MQGNEKERALVALRDLRRGEGLATLIEREQFGEVEVEITTGLTAKATPYMQDGEVHLAGEVYSEQHGGKVTYHVSAPPEVVENMIKDAVEKNVPVRLALWFKTNFGRLPVIRRQLEFPSLPAAPMPVRLIRFRG